MAKPARAPARYRRVIPWRREGRFPKAVLVNQPTPQPGAETLRIPPPIFVPDGFNFPRPEDIFFDASVRVPSILPLTTVDQAVFTLEENVKGGWIRKLGYAFDNPQGFFEVQIFLLISGGPPARYIYKNIDSTSATYSSSFPVVQLGAPEAPTDTFIFLPSGTPVSLRFINNSAVSPYSVTVRLVGWFFAG